MVYVKNNTQEDIADFVDGKKIVFYANSTIELTDREFDTIKDNNKLFVKYIERGKLVKVSKPQIKKIEEIEVANKVLENKVKDSEKKIAEKDNKIEEMEKELNSLKAELNAMAKKKTKKDKDSVEE